MGQKKLSVQYKDYAKWQKRRLSKNGLNDEVDYWKNKLNSFETLNIPTDFNRPKDFTYKGSDIKVPFNGKLRIALEKIAKENGTSLYVVMLSVLDIILSEFSYQTDIVVGTPFANRHIKGTEDLIGFFINTLPIRTQVIGKSKFLDLIRQNDKSVREAQMKQDVPFEKIVNSLEIGHDPSKNPIFQVLFSVQDFLTDELVSNEIFSGMDKSSPVKVARYDLSIMVEDGMIGFNYCTDIYKKATIQAMLSNYVEALENLVKSPQNIENGNIIKSNFKVVGPKVNYGLKTVVDLFKECKDRNPYANATEYQGEKVNYHDFWIETNKFANYLLHCGVKAGDKVPIILKRSEKMAIGIWGILKLGCSYVPISPDFPEDRKKYILEQLDSPFIITDSTFANYKNESSSDLNVTPKSSDLAYIIFTSGTTGNPKGVMISHAGLSNRINWMQSKFSIGVGDKVYQKTNFVFDVSVWEHVWAITVGAEVVYAKDQGHKDPIYLAKEIEEKKINVVHFVPSMLDAFLETMSLYQNDENLDHFDLSSIKYVFSSGEELHSNSVKLFKQILPNAKIFNLYGPTEASIDVTYFDCNISGLNKVTIGKPISNMTCYVLDKENHLVPKGAIGELALGGIQIADGYINQPLLTDKKFITSDDFGKIYKTGDLVRVLEDNNIEFRGRNDFQVKIRGLRIELGEIESRLDRVKGISRSVVLVKSDKIIAYYSGKRKISESKLTKLLSESLTDYMIPDVFVYVEQFSLTANGKLDRRSLPNPELNQDQFVDPRDENERKVTQLVSELLNEDIQNISVTESFFRLGGDSIKAIQLSNRITQKMGQTVTVKQIFDAKNIRNICELLRTNSNGSIRSEQGELLGDVPLLPVQKWFFEEYNSTFFNQSFGISLPADVDNDRLKKALVQLVNYHDALRISFIRGKQRYSPKVNKVDICGVSSKQDIEQLQRSFKFEGPLYRFAIDKRKGELIVVCHHLVIDAVSWQIICDDLHNLYLGKSLPTKGTSYRQWSSLINKTRFDRDDEYSGQKQIKTGRQCKSTHFKIDTVQTKLLLSAVNKVYNTKVDDVLLTALARALKKIEGKDSYYVELESYGRGDINEQVNIQRTVGWFTTIYPQLISTNLLETKHLNRINEDLGIKYGATYGIHEKNMPDIMFNYLGEPDSGKNHDWKVQQGDFGKSTDISLKKPLSLNGIVLNGELNFNLEGNAVKIQQITEEFNSEILKLIKNLEKSERTYLTVDDISAKISQQQLDQLQKDNELDDVLSASPMQEGFVYHALKNSSDNAYTSAYIFKYNEKINPQLYRKAWSIAQEKYSSLRLGLNYDFGTVLQIVLKKATFNFKYLVDGNVTAIAKEERTKRFDLKQGSLFRINLVKDDEEKYSCILTNHHAILDGWSLPILLDFVNRTYLELLKDKKILVITDDAYVNAQNYLQQRTNDALSYWNESFTEPDHPDLSGLFRMDQHTARLEELTSVKKPRDQRYTIKEGIYKQLKDFAEQHDVTVNVIIQYAWHKLLQIYGGINKTTVGVVNAGRNIPVLGIEDSVGLYIKTVPVQYTHTNEPVIVQLKALQNVINNSIAYGNIDLTALQKDTTRLFDSIFIYENYPAPKKSIDGGLSIKSFKGIEKLDYPLTIVLSNYEKTLKFEIKYDGIMFDNSTIDDLFGFLNRIIKQIIAGKNDLTYVDNAIYNAQDTYPKENIVEAFETEVVKDGNKTAILDGNRSYSFKELNGKANKVANKLIDDYGLKTGDRVPLFLEKSSNTIVAILGVLKAGCAYVPMSTAYPSERIDYIKDIVKAKVVIDEEFMQSCEQMNTSNPVVKIHSDALAYIIFTSGTTGRPKGVMVEHRNFLIYLRNILNAIKKNGTEEIEFGCIAEYVFDIFGTEVFAQLLRGKPVNLFTGQPEEFPEFMDSHNVTVLQSTPGKISYMFQDNDEEILKSSLTTIMVGGEKMNQSFANRFKDINLINIYGPTEGTVWTSMKKVDSNYSNIGKPFDNYLHLILSENEKLLPDGAVGELYVGGPQLSRGYYKQEELTKRSFKRNPFNYSGRKEYDRIYKTGDIVRKLPNGDMELIGRNDFQVKIRGFRIELNEIENVMLKVRGVKQALAVATGEGNDKFIGVYYVNDGRNITRMDIEDTISKYLADYMMPAGYLQVPEFPLTINGKIDRRSLPNIELKSGTKFVSPENDIQTKVRELFRDTLDLKVDSISILDDFFRIGGDSIKAIKLLSLLKRNFSKDIRIKDIFRERTVQKIAGWLSKERESDLVPHLGVTKRYFENEAEQVLSYAQRQYQRLGIENNSYTNVKMLFHIDSDVDVRVLERAVKQVVNRQEVLQTKIFDSYQVVDKNAFSITHRKINEEKYLNHIFDLKREIPIKVNIYKNNFACVIDHIAFDGWSTSVFLTEIEKEYYGKRLPELPYQYRDFAACQNEFLAGNGKNGQLNFWKNKLDKYAPVYLSNEQIKSGGEKEGGDYYLSIDEELYRKLQNISVTQNITMHNILLSAFYVMVASVSKCMDISIAIPSVNRDIPGLENLVGLFINQLLINVHISENNTLIKFATKLGNQIIEAQENQDIPFEELVDDLGLKINGTKMYFGIQGFKGEALRKSTLFKPVQKMNEKDEKDAFTDLTLFVWGRTIDFNFDKSLFTEEKVKGYAAIYEQILETFAENQNKIIKKII